MTHLLSSKAISVFCSLTLLVAIGFSGKSEASFFRLYHVYSNSFLVSIGKIVLRNWRAVRKGISTGEIDMSLVIRVACFLFYVFIGLM